MVLRAVPTAVDSADESNGSSALVEHGEAPAFDLASHAKGLETSLRAARERLRAADASVAAIRSGVGDVEARLQRSEELSGRLAAEVDGMRLELSVVADRDILAETVIALRTAYGRVRDERAAALDELAVAASELEELRAALASSEDVLASTRLERDIAEARAVEIAEEAAGDRALAIAQYVTVVEDYANATRAMAQMTASAIDVVQASWVWRVKAFAARLLGRGRPTSAS